MCIVKILCDLEDYLFIAVYRTALFLKPISMNFSISAAVFTIFIVRSFTKTPLSGDYFNYILYLIFFPNKSWIYSLYIYMKLHLTKCFFSL